MDPNAEFRCERCGTKFLNKSNLTRHYRSAKFCIQSYEGAPAVREVFQCKACKREFTRGSSLESHKTKCLTIHKSRIKKLSKKIKLQQKELDDLRRSNTSIDGKVVPYKLRNTPTEYIKPLTIDTIKERLHLYTYEDFKRGQKGIERFFTRLTTEEYGGRSYVCTDISRDKFYRLTEEKVWETDIGGMFINTILDELEEISIEYYKRFAHEQADAVKNVTLRTDLDEQKIDINPVFFGITDTNNRNRRDKLFIKIRAYLRSAASV